MHLPVSVQVRLMGGKIDLTTRVGIGTTFHFVVHFGIPKQTKATTGALDKEPQDPETSSGLQGRRAILVDGIPLRRMVHVPLPLLPSSSHLFVAQNLLVLKLHTKEDQASATFNIYSWSICNLLDDIQLTPVPKIFQILYQLCLSNTTVECNS